MAKKDIDLITSQVTDKKTKPDTTSRISASDKIGPNMGKTNITKDSAIGNLRAKNAEAANRDRSRYVTEKSNAGPSEHIANYEDVAPKKKASSSAAVKPLKDTSDKYWSSSGLSGDMGSASGETGANMGQVNKGGYDPTEGMKRGGKVKMAKGGSASSRADGCATKGKTRGRYI